MRNISGRELYDEMLDKQDQATRLSSELYELENDGLGGSPEWHDLAEEINDLDNEVQRIDDELEHMGWHGE